MNWIIILWLLLFVNLSFAQEADLGIELEVRPSNLLALDQTGFLDVIITNNGPADTSSTFQLTNYDGFPPIVFGEFVSANCRYNPVFDPPPPGALFFWPIDTPTLSAGEFVVCTIPFEHDGSLSQSTIITMIVFPNQADDPDQNNDVASVALTFFDPQPVPAIGTFAFWLLISLMLLGARFLGLVKANNN